jgi:RND family efflux transporter MFP subunit
MVPSLPRGFFTLGRTLALAASAVSVVLCAGCARKDTGGQEVVERIVLPVTATKVTSGRIERFLSYTGNVDAAKRVEIAPLAPGRIVRILVDEGSVVKKGQVLVKMDDLAVASVKAMYEAAKKNLERMKVLHDRGSMTDVQLEGAQSGYDQAKAAYDQVLSGIELIAPFGGIIIGKYYNEDEVYSSMKPGPLGLGSILSLARLNKMKVEINVPEQDYVQIKPGKDVNITVDALQGKNFSGHVSKVSPALDMRSRTAKITIEIDNKDKLIKPGMFTRVRIITEQKDSVLKVPTEAIVIRNDSAFVFKVKNGEPPYDASPIPVRVAPGMSNTEFTEISGEGIKESDLVLSENNVSLTKETAIRVTKIVDSEGK